MSAKTSTAAAGLARRPSPGSAASVAGPALMAAAQSASLGGHAGAAFDF